jgi:radical SAM superfamily enzyme YgiQ (UPF0313 family)
LDALPQPARDLFPVERYFRVNLPMQIVHRHRRNLSVSTSRGCPYACRFCSSAAHWNHRYRARPAGRVLDELTGLRERFDVREVKFEDDNLTFDRSRAERLFRGMIDRRLNLHWNTPNGIAVRHLDDGLLALMRESGCYELTLAVESGDPDVLRNIVGKPLHLEEARHAARRIRAHGIATSGFFIIGFPGETLQQIRNTLRFAEELALDRTYIFFYTPLPGTPLAEEALRGGWVGPGFDFESANNYFHPSVTPAGVTAEELARMQRRAFWHCNLRPLRRAPWRFARNYWATLKEHPEFFARFLRVIGGTPS